VTPWTLPTPAVVSPDDGPNCGERGTWLAATTWVDTSTGKNARPSSTSCQGRRGPGRFAGEAIHHYGLSSCFITRQLSITNTTNGQMTQISLEYIENIRDIRRFVSFVIKVWAFDKSVGQQILVSDWPGWELRRQRPVPQMPRCGKRRRRWGPGGWALC